MAEHITESNQAISDPHAPQHPYHLVDPSPWPFASAIAVLVTAVGAVLAMHNHDKWLFIGGIAALLLIAAAWWRDVIIEAQAHKQHTSAVQTGLRIGMILFIVSEVMFFAGFFGAYFDISLNPAEILGHVWPPQGTKTIDPFHLPYLNTLILLLSGTTITWAHHALRLNQRPELVRGLALTVLLGLSFTAIQAYEYHHAPFAFNSGVYASMFYMTTGFHGLHVIIGTLFLIVCLARAMRGHFATDHHVGFEAAAWYWHFVDVVWLFLFLSIYI